MTQGPQPALTVRERMIDEVTRSIYVKLHAFVVPHVKTEAQKGFVAYPFLDPEFNYEFNRLAREYTAA